MITAAMRRAWLPGDAGALKGTRDARLALVEVGRGAGAAVDRADDDRGDAFCVLAINIGIGQSVG
jgi:hypothetical protein